MGWPKVLAKLLKSLVGKSSHHIQSTRDFVNRLKGVTLLPGECLCSYNVTTLFTSVPIDPALIIIKDLLEQDDTLWDRTVLSVQNTIELLGFCLHNTYFSFHNKVLWTGWRCSSGFSCKSNCGQLVHGIFGKGTSMVCPHPSQALVQVCGWHLCYSTTGQ